MKRTRIITPCGTIYHGRVVSGERKGKKLIMVFEMDLQEKGGDTDG